MKNCFACNANCPNAGIDGLWGDELCGGESGDPTAQGDNGMPDTDSYIAQMQFLDWESEDAACGKNTECEEEEK